MNELKPCPFCGGNAELRQRKMIPNMEKQHLSLV